MKPGTSLLAWKYTVPSVFNASRPLLNHQAARGTKGWSCQHGVITKPNPAQRGTRIPMLRPT